MLSNDEARLVQQALAGSGDAAAVLFRRHWPAVWRVAYTVLGSRATADDVAQEAMVKAFSRLGAFDERRPLAPWLKRIAFNGAVDELRHQRRVAEDESRDLDFAAMSAPEAPELEAAGGVARAVARLPLDRRAIIVLHYWLDCTREEIAEILDLPVGTVASRLGRALAELRSRLEEEHVH